MSEKKVALMEFENNPNIGLFMFVNDKFCLLGKEVEKKKKEQIEEVLKVPVYTLRVLGTELPGVFISGDNQRIVVPEIFDHEKKVLEKICKDHEVEYVEIPHRFNTYGNGLRFGAEECIVGGEYPTSFVKELEKKVTTKIVKLEGKEYQGAGSLLYFANGKYFASQELEEGQVTDILEKIGGVGSVNSGSAFVGSGIVGNSQGLLLGSLCSTVEIQSIVEALEYL